MARRLASEPFQIGANVLYSVHHLVGIFCGPALQGQGQGSRLESPGNRDMWWNNAEKGGKKLIVQRGNKLISDTVFDT